MSYAEALALDDSGSSRHDWSDWSPLPSLPSINKPTNQIRRGGPRYDIAQLDADNILKKEFDELVKRWKDNVIDYSRIADMIADEAYLSIIAKGMPIVTHLLRELESSPDYWFAALRAILGFDPADDEDRGNLSKMAEAWINWGRDEGYLSR